MLELLGINSANTLFVSEPLIFKEIYVPEQSLILRRSLTGFQRETWWVLSKAVDVSPGKEKVYISRTKLGVSDREMENELQLERFLEAQGFTIVYPEESVLDEQIKFFEMQIS